MKRAHTIGIVLVKRTGMGYKRVEWGRDLGSPLFSGRVCYSHCIDGITESFRGFWRGIKMKWCYCTCAVVVLAENDQEHKFLLERGSLSYETGSNS